MQKNRKTEEMQGMIEEICPQAINSMRDLLVNPSTPVSSKVQLIGMILDRTLGKTETPLRVTAGAESLEEAEVRLQELVKEMTNSGSMLTGKQTSGRTPPGGEASEGTVIGKETHERE